MTGYQHLKTRWLLALLFCWLNTISVAHADINFPAIIPVPQQISVQPGTFSLQPAHHALGLFAHGGTKIMADASARPTAEFLAHRLHQSTGYRIAICNPGPNATGNILLTTQNASAQLGPEGYELSITPDNVVIRAPQSAGLFYGAQTILQLFPPEVFSTNTVYVRDPDFLWQIPCVHIRDWPRFAWRGLMLDVSRHFFTKSEVETVLDLMALHKLNKFHWHLTDDHGWRIQIKKYPRLTSVGAWRPDVGFGLSSNSTTAYGPDARYGGFYTPADIREIVNYAAARHIDVIPEIEMPGHSSAALTAYPQYSCTGGPFTNRETAGVFDGIYDPAKPEMFQFLDNILAEVIPLFPYRYLHIGGDEVPKKTWTNSPDCQALMQREGLKNAQELQSWFTRRIEKIVSAHGRTIIGWSEILQGGVATNAVVMDWLGNAATAARTGHDIVMSPTAYCYFDFYQSTNHAIEPKAASWHNALTLWQVYSYDPMPTNLPPELQFHILGTQANLWTEWIPNLAHVEYMYFPRACALSEIAWSSRATLDWSDFQRRLTIQSRRFDKMGVNYRHAGRERLELESLH